MPVMNMAPALARAKEVFAGQDPVQMASRARVLFDETASVFSVPFLGCQYKVNFPGAAFEESAQVSIASQILMLHYLTGASGATPSGRMISFKELPGGSIYNGPFTGRAIRPLVSFFGHRPGLLREAARRLGGDETGGGDTAVCVPAFPLIHLTLVLWEGDEEFEPGGNILFDATAPFHLPTEDYAVLAETVVGALRKMAG